MTFKGPFEDLLLSLSAIPGALGKLTYLAGLRSEESYQHWGLARVHGSDKAEQAMRSAHEAIFLHVLRTPLKELVEDVELSAFAGHNGPVEFLSDFLNPSSDPIPANRGGGSDIHFTAVQVSLAKIFRCPAETIRRAA